MMWWGQQVLTPEFWMLMYHSMLLRTSSKLSLDGCQWPTAHGQPNFRRYLELGCPESGGPLRSRGWMTYRLGTASWGSMQEAEN